MNESFENRYLSHIDKSLSELRDKLLGLDTPLSAVLPPQVKKDTPEAQAEHLTDRLIFCLASQGVHSQRVLSDCRMFLRPIILFLLRFCRLEDQTFRSIRKLCLLEDGARSIIFKDHRMMDRRMLSSAPCPVEQESLEQAFMMLVGTYKPLSENYKIVKGIEDFLAPCQQPAKRSVLWKP